VTEDDAGSDEQLAMGASAGRKLVSARKSQSSSSSSSKMESSNVGEPDFSFSVQFGTRSMEQATKAIQDKIDPKPTATTIPENSVLVAFGAMYYKCEGLGVQVEAKKEMHQGAKLDQVIAKVKDTAFKNLLETLAPTTELQKTIDFVAIREVKVNGKDRKPAWVAEFGGGIDVGSGKTAVNDQYGKVLWESYDHMRDFAIDKNGTTLEKLVVNQPKELGKIQFIYKEKKRTVKATAKYNASNIDEETIRALLKGLKAALMGYKVQKAIADGDLQWNGKFQAFASGSWRDDDDQPTANFDMLKEAWNRKGLDKVASLNIIKGDEEAGLGLPNALNIVMGSEVGKEWKAENKNFFVMEGGGGSIQVGLWTAKSEEAKSDTTDTEARKTLDTMETETTSDYWRGTIGDLIKQDSARKKATLDTKEKGSPTESEVQSEHFTDPLDPEGDFSDPDFSRRLSRHPQTS